MFRNSWTLMYPVWAPIQTKPRNCFKADFFHFLWEKFYSVMSFKSAVTVCIYAMCCLIVCYLTQMFFVPTYLLGEKKRAFFMLCYHGIQEKVDVSIQAVCLLFGSQEDSCSASLFTLWHNYKKKQSTVGHKIGETTIQGFIYCSQVGADRGQLFYFCGISQRLYESIQEPKHCNVQNNMSFSQ